MLIIDKLSKIYGSVRAVDDVSVSIQEGEFIGVIGSSGAGKSTLLRAINRLTEPDCGKIFHDGTDITALKGKDLLKWRSQCAMIFQQFNLVKRLDAITNVLCGALNGHGFFKSMLMIFPRHQRLLAASHLENVGILNQALKRCDQLSGGQQQRVAIARAMMQNPTMILADEPIASLDPKSAKKVMDSLLAINREKKITVMTSLHHLASARQYCGRIIGMSSGKIIFDGTPGELTSEIVREIYGAKEAAEELEHDRDNWTAMVGSSTGEAPNLFTDMSLHLEKI